MTGPDTKLAVSAASETTACASSSTPCSSRSNDTLDGVGRALEERGEAIGHRDGLRTSRLAPGSAEEGPPSSGPGLARLGRRVLDLDHEALPLEEAEEPTGELPAVAQDGQLGHVGAEALAGPLPGRLHRLCLKAQRPGHGAPLLSC